MRRARQYGLMESPRPMLKHRSYSVVSHHRPNPRRRRRVRARFGVITGPNESGKCCHRSTLLTDAITGETRTIEEWRTAVALGIPFHVHGRDEGLKLRPTRVTEVFPTGRKPILRVILENGHFEDVSDTHPEMTPSGTKPASKLRPGDLVEIPRHLRIASTSNDELTDEDLVIIAAFMADGRLSRSAYFLTTPNTQLVELVCQALKRRHLSLTSTDDLHHWVVAQVPRKTPERQQLMAGAGRIFDEAGVPLPVARSNQLRVRSGERGISLDALLKLDHPELREITTALYPNAMLRRYLRQLGIDGKVAKEKKLPPQFWWCSEAQL